MTTVQDAAREAHASGATVVEIAEALDAPIEQVAEWLGAQAHTRNVDAYTLVQELVADVQEQLRTASASGDHSAAKSLSATLSRLVPALERVERARAVDGVLITPAELDAAREYVKDMVTAATRGGKRCDT